MSSRRVQPVRYRETLLPSPGLWAVTLLVSATLGLTVLRVLGTLAAGALAAVAVLLAALALLRSSALVEVADGQLRAGRARIPVHLLGRVRVLPAERMAALRGPEADARAYLCQRGWIAEGVLVEVLDPEDEVPYWLVSSRTPQRLAAALVEEQRRSDRGEPPADGSGQAHSKQTG